MKTTMPRLPRSRQPAPRRPGVPAAGWDSSGPTWPPVQELGDARPVIRSSETGAQPRVRSQRRDPSPPRLFALLLGRRTELLLEAGAFLAGLCAPLALMALGLMAPLAASLAGMDLDAERVALVSWLGLMLAGGMLAAALARRRLAVLLGAATAYAVWYVAPFVMQAQHPRAAPVGLREVLLPGALFSLAGTLLALGVTFAALGVFTGAALGELLVEPVLALARKHRLARRRRAASAPSLPRAAVSLAAGVLLVVVALVGVMGLEPLLVDGLSTGLYQLAPGAQAGATGPIPSGVVRQESYRSPALGGALRTFYIYLPPTYAAAPGTRFPVLYLLHGHPGHAPNWFVAGHAAQIEDALIATHRVRPLIMVAPDGNGTLYPTSQWANSYTHLQQMEDSVAGDLVHWIDAHYRTLADPADRLIAGNSEGGFGAVNIALHHPDVFGAAISLGGYFEAIGNVFGVGPAAAAFRAYNSPAQYVLTPAGRASAHRIRFVIGVGAADHTYYATGVNFVATLASIGVGARLLVDPGGHSWTIWSAQLGDALAGLAPPNGG